MFITFLVGLKINYQSNNPNIPYNQGFIIYNLYRIFHTTMASLVIF